MISQNTIEQVKSTAQIIEVVGRYVTLKKDGVNVVGLCPFHNEKTPSFKVSKSKNIFKCFGCGETGDSISFVMKHEKKNFSDAIKLIADFYNITVEEEKIEQRRTYVKPEKSTTGFSQYTKSYFKNRGISSEILEELRVTDGKEWMPKAKKETDVICFNYYRDGELINIKYRGENKDFKLYKDAELIFYNLDACKEFKAVIIVEGEIDCLSVRQCGIKSVISVPNGASASISKLEYLDNCFEFFAEKTDIIIMTDNDVPGIKLRDELARRIGYDRCFKVEYPHECKDANDILVKYGEAFLKKTIEDAKEFPIEGVFEISDIQDEIRNFFENGYPQGVKVGISNFDDHISFMPGQFTTITGIPGSGKSEFVDYIMTQTAKNHSWAWAVCSFENQPSSLHATKLMEKYTGRSFSKRYNSYDQMNIIDFQNSLNFVGNFFYFININKIQVTLDGILEKAKELVLRKGIKGLLVDPWNYIEHKSVVGQTETQYVSECLTKIKSFAISHGIHIFLVAHPTKLGKTNNKYDVPTLYNISGSAHFFNKTDNGITVYRHFDTNKVDIHIQKIRYSWLGKIGMCTFTYNVNTRQYEYT